MNANELIDGARFTVLLGKNGAGKSTLLRSLIDAGGHTVKYISPERGGTLKYDPNVDNNLSNIPNWLRESRRVNRLDQFRQQSAAQFRSLEMLVLREIEQDLSKRQDNEYTFDRVLTLINNLLPAIKLVRSDRGFTIASKQNIQIAEETISSGESELIALSIEVLVFSRSTEENKLLLLDEPDVHLHPDLQQKFIRFVEDVAVQHDIKVVIATHSTAVIGAFTSTADLQVTPVASRSQTDFINFRRSTVAEQILPVFGAHPLSSMFNKTPVVLVEGEDDRRILDQVVRSSNGNILFLPCVVGTVNDMTHWEQWLDQILPAIYDEARAFSLRDLDDSNQTEINDIGCVCRLRLNCYAMENLLLTSQNLASHGFANDDAFIEKLKSYASVSTDHKFYEDVLQLIEGFADRRRLKIKNVRNIIVALLGTNKPWEVVVGQLIAKHVGKNDSEANSLQTYIGDKALNSLFRTSTGASSATEVLT